MLLLSLTIDADHVCATTNAKYEFGMMPSLRCGSGG
jgi:hypothetical protein